MKLYVVLRSVNEYDQFGEYFESVHSTYEDALASVDHIGRVNYEYEWFDIIETEFGVKYISDSDIYHGVRQHRYEQDIE